MLWERTAEWRKERPRLRGNGKAVKQKKTNKITNKIEKEKRKKKHKYKAPRRGPLPQENKERRLDAQT